MPKTRAPQDVKEGEIPLPRGRTHKVPQEVNLRETGLLPDNHWRIVDE
jgi:hypothetical protein